MLLKKPLWTVRPELRPGQVRFCIHTFRLNRNQIINHPEEPGKWVGFVAHFPATADLGAPIFNLNRSSRNVWILNRSRLRRAEIIPECSSTLACSACLLQIRTQQHLLLEFKGINLFILRQAIMPKEATVFGTILKARFQIATHVLLVDSSTSLKNGYFHV